MDRFLVISSDCHAGLPGKRYREYLDPQYRDEFDRQYEARMAALEAASISLEMRNESLRWAADKSEGLSGAWDHDQRIKVMDGDGIAAEVLFVDGLTEENSPPFGGDLGMSPVGADPELQWAGARSHNRWMSEFVSLAPDRRFGLAQVPCLWDVDEAVKEINWAKENGLGGIMIPPMWHHLSPYHHPKYEPMWAACEDLGMIIHFHSGPAAMTDYFGSALFGAPSATGEPAVEMPGALGIYVTEVAWWMARPLVFMIWGGVFERYPELQAVCTEGTSIWAPELKELMDHRYSAHHFTAKLGTEYKANISMEPSKYFERNIGLGSSCMPRREAEMRHDIGIRNMMWGSDYPHPEGTWPYTQKMMLETFHGLPEDDIAALLGGNALRIYGFDEEKLRKIADRIGPKKSLFRDESSA